MLIGTMVSDAPDISVPDLAREVAVNSPPLCDYPSLKHLKSIRLKDARRIATITGIRPLYLIADFGS